MRSDGDNDSSTRRQGFGDESGVVAGYRRGFRAGFLSFILLSKFSEGERAKGFQITLMNLVQVLPEAPEDLVCDCLGDYNKSKFEVLSSEEPIHERISRNVASALASLK
ncbi:hypothetical protein HN51_063583 [Arachis hypogaea]